MGAGNVCVSGKYSGLFYVEWTKIMLKQQNGSFDYDSAHYMLDKYCDDFCDSVVKKCKSFSKVHDRRWIDRSKRVLLENQLFYICVEDNDWSVAFELIQKDSMYCNNVNPENLQAKHYITYLNVIQSVLFERFNAIGTYSGAWTSGLRTKEQFEHMVKTRKENMKLRKGY